MADLDKLLKMTAEAKASDLHLSCGAPPIWRLHGDIVPVPDAPVLGTELATKLLRDICPQVNWKQFEEIHDTDFGYELAGCGRFRINFFLDRKGPGAVCRLIPTKIMTVEELGLSKPIIRLCHMSKGLVLVTGPTGSGKSTTLAALIDYINRVRSGHIITIEDPIEFVHENKKCLINQREVHSHTDSFKHALRAALREDPNILMVGELRDLETIEIAIETAETGHLVFGTLHTNTAPATVERVIEQFPEAKQNQVRQMLANSLKGVIAQALLKRADGRGRVVAVEFLLINNAISNLIREGKTYQIGSIMQTSGKQGMLLLNDALLKLVTARTVSPDEAYLYSVDKDDFQRKLAQAGIAFDASFHSDHIRSEPLAKELGPTTSASAAEADDGEERVMEPTVRSKPMAADDFQTFRQRLFKKTGQA